jgi:hypothetical protein
MGRGEPWAGGRGTHRTYDPAYGACSFSCRLSGPTRLEIEEEGQVEGAAGKAFPAGARTSGLTVAEREEGAKGEGATSASFSTGERDEGGAGVRTCTLLFDVRTLVSPISKR